MDEKYLGLSAIREEVLSASPEPREKDILLVVRDQLDYVKECVSSIQHHTENYHLFIYDNGSLPETRDYLRGLGDDVTLCRDEENKGFIYPNNFLIQHGNAPYVILINSDAIVYEGWDLVLTGFLEKNPAFAQVGFMGGYLDSNGKGIRGGFGSSVDYVCGWCFCIPRYVYNEFGLFDDKNLKFAYCEDSDFSMRLKEAGRKIHALGVPLAYHYGNKTVLEVMKQQDINPFVIANHEYLRKRWRRFLPSANLER